MIYDKLYNNRCFTDATAVFNIYHRLHISLAHSTGFLVVNLEKLVFFMEMQKIFGKNIN